MTARWQPPLFELADRRPDDPAVDDGVRADTWGELDRRTRALAHGLDALAGGPGRHVALVADNRTEFIEVALGCLRAGLVYTPVKSNWKANEVTKVLDDAGTTLVVTDVEGGRAAAAAAGLPVVDLDDDFEGWVAQADDGPVPYERAGRKLTYTSGTTGRPKGVVLAGAGGAPFPEAFVASTGQAVAIGLPRDGTHLFVSRLFHGAPLTFGLAALARGAALRIMRTWDAADALVLLQDGVSSSCMVPTMFRQFLALPEETRAGFAAPLLRVAHGGEPCPVPLKQAMVDWWGPVFTEYYGFSEGGMTVATPEDWSARPGTVGRAVRGRRIIIVGPDDEELPVGREGTIYFESPDGSSFHYHGDEAKTSAAHRGRAFTVGDIGRVDEDGYLYVTGRTADVIVVSGVNIYPAEIESELSGTDGLADLAVAGAPDPLRGEQVVAFVVPAHDVEPVELLARLEGLAAARLAGNKRPRAYRLVEALPRDPTGKLLRKDLQQLLSAEGPTGAPTEGAP